MRFIATLALGAIALSAMSTAQSADLLATSISINQIRATATYLATGTSEPVVQGGLVSSLSELPMWQGLETNQVAGMPFGDSAPLFVHANQPLATDGYVFDEALTRGRVLVEPGKVTLSQAIPGSEPIKEQMVRPANMGLGGLDQMVESHSVWMSLSQAPFTPYRMLVAPNSVLEIAVDVTLNHLADASTFSTDPLLSQAFGKTFTGVSASSTATFSVSLGQWQGGSSASISSQSAYAIDHIGQVTTSGDNRQGLHTLTARFENTSASNVLVDFDLSLQTSTSLRTTFDPALVASVPEPSTWALMLAGVAFAGLSARRRQAA